jgi:hypothetical protein
VNARVLENECAIIERKTGGKGVGVREKGNRDDEEDEPSRSRIW